MRGATRCGALISSDCAHRSDDADNVCTGVVCPSRSRVASARPRVACVGDAAPSNSSDDGDGEGRDEM